MYKFFKTKNYVYKAIYTISNQNSNLPISVALLDVYEWDAKKLTLFALNTGGTPYKLKHQKNNKCTTRRASVQSTHIQNICLCTLD